MAKLTKQESKMHVKVMDLVHSDRSLTMDEKLFILSNYQESFGNTNSLAGAFFTPYGLSRDTMLEVDNGTVIIDLCAGIGSLTLAALNQCNPSAIISIELNSDYITAGKRVAPESCWVHDDVFNAINELSVMGKDAIVISNPPFGQIGTGSGYSGGYSGGDFEFKIIEAARQISHRGVFIIPQCSTPFKYSGNLYFEKTSSRKYERFNTQTKLEFEFNSGIDTSVYIKEWHGVSPVCEIVNVTY